MDFGFNSDQELLRATARKFFDNECTSEFVRARMAEDAGFTEEFWTKLAEGGRVIQSLAPTPWGAPYGMVTDRFGVTWIVGTNPG